MKTNFRTWVNSKKDSFKKLKTLVKRTGKPQRNQRDQINSKLDFGPRMNNNLLMMGRTNLILLIC